jgi:pimeloyl-ACP methyl ester carboxylesterase
MPAWSLGYLAWRLRRCGFAPHLFGYPSVRAGLESNAARLARFVTERGAAQPVHLVGHSLGGLVIRTMLAQYPERPFGRVVMLASPQQGSVVAKRLARFAPARAILGRSVADMLAGRLLRFDPQEAYRRHLVGVIRGELGIGLGRLLYPGLARPHDGLLSAAETRLEGAADEIALPVSHTGMLFSRRVAEAVCRFLRDGRFRPAANTPA